MKISNPKILILFSLISLYLTIQWLPSNQILGGGDVGIPTLFPQKQLKELMSSWWESHATGITSPVTFTAVPLYIIFSFFDIIGFNGSTIQKGLFFSILFGGSISIYFLALSFNFKKWTALIASLFYIFNLTTLSVWQRGVHNGMLFLFLAPLSLLILHWGITKRKYSFIILINIVSLLLSYVFGALGFVFSLWLLWSTYILIMLLSNWGDKKSRKFILIYFFLLIIFWIATNSWWLFHFIQSSKYALGQFTQEELRSKGSGVLFSLKTYHNPMFILRGLSAFSLFGVKDWGDIYQNPLMLLLSWIPILFVLFTTLSKANYKNNYWRFLIALLAIIFILSKGVNPPLGLLNAWPYDLFPFLAPLRNPYEKIGILLPIPFSLLFAYGFNQVNIYLKGKKLFFLTFLNLLIVFLCFTILVWPLWFGKLFGSEGRKYIFSIPSYYKQADDWLKNKVLLEDTRILHLPLSWGESVDYNWGYTGIEPSQYLFSGSSIGYQIGIASVDSRIRDLLISIHNLDTLNISKSLASLNVGWVVVHNETVWRPRILESPTRISSWISQNPDFLERQIDFGPLSIYRIKDHYRLGHFYSIGNLIKTNRPSQYNTFKVWDDIEKLNDGFLTEIQDKQEEMLSKFIEKSIIFPINKMKYYPQNLPLADIALKEIAKVLTLPDSPIYPLVVFKESILNFLNQDDPVRECFSLSGKRLKEAVLLKDKSNEARKALIKYQRQLDDCIKIGNETLSMYLNIPILREEVISSLLRQKVILEEGFFPKEASNMMFDILQSLNEYLANLGISPKYQVMNNEEAKQTLIMDYNIGEEGDYSFKIKQPREELIQSPPKIIKIDDQIVNISPNKINKDSIVYSSSKLAKGFHEIHLLAQESENLVKDSLMVKKDYPDPGFKLSDQASSPAFLGESLDRPISLSFDLNNLDVEGLYNLIFDMDFFQGNQPVITITYDSDQQDSSGNLQPSIIKELNVTNYPIEIKRIRLEFRPPLNSTSAKITFHLTPFSKALIKRIKVEKLSNSDLILEKMNKGVIQDKGGVSVKWRKMDPTLYNLDLSNQSPPYILTFSETFHEEWKIINSQNQVIDIPHFSINDFANGWLVSKSLPENISIKFELQDTFGKGFLVAILSFAVSVILFSYLDLRRKIK